MRRSDPKRKNRPQMRSDKPRGGRTRKTKRSKAAILNVEASGARLRRPELLRLLDSELSRICRERDNYTCFITGRRCEPGIGPGMGNAAHWLPRASVPFWLRYDPRVVFWCEGIAHAEFDGRMSRFNRVAQQAFAWGKLAKEKPDVFELLTGTDWKHQPRETVRIDEIRDKLEELRRL